MDSAEERLGAGGATEAQQPSVDNSHHDPDVPLLPENDPLLTPLPSSPVPDPTAYSSALTDSHLSSAALEGSIAPAVAMVGNREAQDASFPVPVAPPESSSLLLPTCSDEHEAEHASCSTTQPLNSPDLCPPHSDESLPNAVEERPVVDLLARDGDLSLKSDSGAVSGVVTDDLALKSEPDAAAGEDAGDGHKRKRGVDDDGSRNSPNRPVVRYCPAEEGAIGVHPTTPAESAALVEKQHGEDEAGHETVAEVIESDDTVHISEDQVIDAVVEQERVDSGETVSNNENDQKEEADTTSGMAGAVAETGPQESPVLQEKEYRAEEFIDSAEEKTPSNSSGLGISTPEVEGVQAPGDAVTVVAEETARQPTHGAEVDGAATALENESTADALSTKNSEPRASELAIATTEGQQHDDSRDGSTSRKEECSTKDAPGGDFSLEQVSKKLGPAQSTTGAMGNENADALGASGEDDEVENLNSEGENLSPTGEVWIPRCRATSPTTVQHGHETAVGAEVESVPQLPLPVNVETDVAGGEEQAGTAKALSESKCASQLSTATEDKEEETGVDYLERAKMELDEEMRIFETMVDESQEEDNEPTVNQDSDATSIPSSSCQPVLHETRVDSVSEVQGGEGTGPAPPQVAASAAATVEAGDIFVVPAPPVVPQQHQNVETTVRVDTSFLPSGHESGTPEVGLPAIGVSVGLAEANAADIIPIPDGCLSAQPHVVTVSSEPEASIDHCEDSTSTTTEMVAEPSKGGPTAVEDAAIVTDTESNKLACSEEADVREKDVSSPKQDASGDDADSEDLPEVPSGPEDSNVGIEGSVRTTNEQPGNDTTDTGPEHSPSIDSTHDEGGHAENDEMPQLTPLVELLTPGADGEIIGPTGRGDEGIADVACPESVPNSNDTQDVGQEQALPEANENDPQVSISDTEPSCIAEEAGEEECAVTTRGDESTEASNRDLSLAQATDAAVDAGTSLAQPVAEVMDAATTEAEASGVEVAEEQESGQEGDTDAAQIQSTVEDSEPTARCVVGDAIAGDAGATENSNESPVVYVVDTDVTTGDNSAEDESVSNETVLIASCPEQLHALGKESLAEIPDPCSNPTDRSGIEIGPFALSTVDDVSTNEPMEKAIDSTPASPGVQTPSSAVLPSQNGDAVERDVDDTSSHPTSCVEVLETSNVCSVETSADGISIPAIDTVVPESGGSQEDGLSSIVPEVVNEDITLHAVSVGELASGIPDVHVTESSSAESTHVLAAAIIGSTTGTSLPSAENPCETQHADGDKGKSEEENVLSSTCDFSTTLEDRASPSEAGSAAVPEATTSPFPPGAATAGEKQQDGSRGLESKEDTAGSPVRDASLVALEEAAVDVSITDQMSSGAAIPGDEQHVGDGGFQSEEGKVSAAVCDADLFAPAAPVASVGEGMAEPITEPVSCSEASPCKEQRVGGHDNKSEDIVGSPVRDASLAAVEAAVDTSTSNAASLNKEPSREEQQIDIGGNRSEEGNVTSPIYDAAVMGTQMEAGTEPTKNPESPSTETPREEKNGSRISLARDNTLETAAVEQQCGDDGDESGKEEARPSMNASALSPGTAEAAPEVNVSSDSETPNEGNVSEEEEEEEARPSIHESTLLSTTAAAEVEVATVAETPCVEQQCSGDSNSSEEEGDPAMQESTLSPSTAEMATAVAAEVVVAPVAEIPCEEEEALAPMNESTLSPARSVDVAVAPVAEIPSDGDEANSEENHPSFCDDFPTAAAATLAVAAEPEAVVTLSITGPDSSHTEKLSEEQLVVDGGKHNEEEDCMAPICDVPLISTAVVAVETGVEVATSTTISDSLNALTPQEQQPTDDGERFNPDEASTRSPSCSPTLVSPTVKTAGVVVEADAGAGAGAGAGATQSASTPAEEQQVDVGRVQSEKEKTNSPSYDATTTSSTGAATAVVFQSTENPCDQEQQKQHKVVENEPKFEADIASPPACDASLESKKTVTVGKASGAKSSAVKSGAAVDAGRDSSVRAVSIGKEAHIVQENIKEAGIGDATKETPSERGRGVKARREGVGSTSASNSAKRASENRPQGGGDTRNAFGWPIQLVLVVVVLGSLWALRPWGGAEDVLEPPLDDLLEPPLDDTLL